MTFIGKDANEIFINSLKNEIYGDTLVNHDIRSEEILGFNIIRPDLFYNKIQKYPQCYKWVFKILFSTWWLLGLMYTFWLFIKTVFKVSLVKRKEVPKKAMLLFSERLIDMALNISEHNLLPKDWITPVNYKKSKEFTDRYGKNVTSIYELCFFRTCFKSLIYAIKAPRHVKKIQTESYHGIFSYAAFDWYLTYFTLIENEFTEVCFSNHYDRWAVLFDNLSCSSIVILQHGILNDRICPPIKLKNITLVYCYNAVQSVFFKERIIDSYKCSYRFFESYIKLVPLQNTEKLTLLLISCMSITFDYEMELFKALKNSKLDIYLKTHPTIPFKPYIKPASDYNIKLITDKGIFPKVDLVISYQSTLAFEYELLGVQVLYYEQDSVKDLIGKVNEMEAKKLYS